MYWVFMLLTELKTNWEIVVSIKTMENKYKSKKELKERIKEPFTKNCIYSMKKRLKEVKSKTRLKKCIRFIFDFMKYYNNILLIVNIKNKIFSIFSFWPLYS